jgi:hypothetical protein
MLVRRTRLALCAACMTGYGGIALTQPAEPPLPSDTLIFSPAVAAPIAALGGAVNILGTEANVPGVVVENKPYSASSITETVQILADGNRISQRNEAKVFRDSAGRTRREQTLGGFGSWPIAGEPVTLINIHDPVADKSYSLDPAARTAREFRSLRLTLPSGGAGSEGEADQVMTFTAPAAPPPVPPASGIAVFQAERVAVGGVTSSFGGGVAVTRSVTPLGMGSPQAGEDLGSQVLEGLLVQGTRFTMVMPSGALGNDRPIEIVTERWYSPDIEAVVWQRHFDPRFGETSYRLVNVVRGEPSPDLFMVPQGYELATGGGPGFEWRGFEAAPASGGAQLNERRLRLRAEPDGDR